MTAGRLRGTLSSIDSAGAALPLALRSACFSASQFRSTSPEDAAVSSPKTWGCRRTIFAVTPPMTSATVNRPSSAAIWAWKTTWSRRSPSSPARSSSVPSSMAIKTS